MSLNITIVGLRQLGGSLGLALGTLDQAVLPSGRPVITGWDGDKRALRDARDRLMIDREARDPADAAGDADVIFVTTPLTELAATFDALAPHLKHGAVVSDTGSVMVEALAIAKRHLPTTVEYIGGHPLVSGGGPQTAASAGLLNGAIYCLAPDVRARPGAIDLLAELVTVIGAKPYYIDAHEHDSYVAGVQHLPILLSAALLDIVRNSGGWRDMQALAGDALQLATQFAAVDPATASADLAANGTAIAQRLDELLALLTELRDEIGQPERMEKLLQNARDTYTAWQSSQPNMRPGERDYYGDSADTTSRGVGGFLWGQRKKR
jgi:prephenate dehydrogenase